MENLILFKDPTALVALTVIVALHVITALADLKSNDRAISLAASILNVVMHVTLIALALIRGAGTDELMLALMISAAIGIVSIGITEKLKGKGGE